MKARKKSVSRQEQEQRQREFDRAHSHWRLEDGSKHFQQQGKPGFQRGAFRAT